MSIPYECLPCFMRQAVALVERKIRDDNAASRVLHLAIDALHRFDSPGVSSAPAMAASFYSALAQAMGEEDPFKEEKDTATALLLSALPTLRGHIQAAADPFAAAVRLAVAGNVVDLGSDPGFDSRRAAEAVLAAAEEPLFTDHTRILKEKAARAASILYLGDNAGEVVLDRLLIEHLPENKVVFAVRGGPVINDVTAGDALRAGLGPLCKIVSTGDPSPGVLLDRVSQEFHSLFLDADLVIAKGQGNFESLFASSPREIFFLFKVKCRFISGLTRAPLGSQMVLEFNPQG